MTVDEFVEKTEGQFIDWDGKYGPQCVDLMRYYIHRVFGTEQPKGVDGAKDFFTLFEQTWDETKWEKIVNEPTTLPKKGDIVIWGNGVYGHVAIFLGGDLRTFTSFDQNYPVIWAPPKSNGTPPTKVVHTYANVLGFIRYKE